MNLLKIPHSHPPLSWTNVTCSPCACIQRQVGPCHQHFVWRLQLHCGYSMDRQRLHVWSVLGLWCTRDQLSSSGHALWIQSYKHNFPSHHYLGSVLHCCKSCIRMSSIVCHPRFEPLWRQAYCHTLSKSGFLWIQCPNLLDDFVGCTFLLINYWLYIFIN